MKSNFSLTETTQEKNTQNVCTVEKTHVKDSIFRKLAQTLSRKKKNMDHENCFCMDL